MTEEIKTEETESKKSEQAVELDSKPSVKKSESLESALRRFKKQSSGIISEVRKREAYDKPSVKRKKKSKEARKHKKNIKFRSGR